jgi:hypothetical protein
MFAGAEDTVCVSETGRREENRMEKWEYATVVLEWSINGRGEAVPVLGSFAVVLNHWGEQGWEAVAYTPVTIVNGQSAQGESISSSITYHVLLKRRKQRG